MSRTKRLRAAPCSREWIFRSETWSTTRRRTEAFAAYQDFLRLAEEGAQRYSRLYGPITKRDLLNAETYTWLKSPWPWEYRGSMEG